MALPSQIVPIFKQVDAGNNSINVGSAGSEAVQLTEADGLIPNAEYFVMWYITLGIDKTAVSPQAEVRATGASTLGKVFCIVSGLSSMPDRPWNSGPLQGFRRYTADSAPVITLYAGRSLFAAPEGDDGTVYWEAATLIAIPIDTLTENEDYWIDDSVDVDTSVQMSGPDFPRAIRTNTFVLPDAGNYLCMWQCGIAAGSAATSIQITKWVPSIDGLSTVEGSGNSVVNPVPNGTSTFDVNGFQHGQRNVSASWQFARVNRAWYSLENLTSGSHTFDHWGGNLGITAGFSFMPRIAVFRSASFLRGITQTRQTSIQLMTGGAKVWESASNQAVTVTPTKGHHVAMTASAIRDNGDTSNCVRTRINNSNGNFYSFHGGLAHQSETGDNSYGVCSIAAEDVTGVVANTVWDLDVQRVKNLGTLAFGSGTGAQIVDTNLIVWNLGEEVEAAVSTDVELEAQTKTLVDYLPSGRAWGAKNRENSNLRSFFRGLAHELDRVTRDIRLFQDEILPDRTTLFLKEWEDCVAIPDNCFLGTGSNDERRTDLLTKLASVGVQTVSDFTALAAKFDLDITIGTGVEHGTLPLTLPFVLFASVTAPRFSIVVSYVVPDAVTFPYTFPIPFTTPALTILECLFNELKPANCQVVFIGVSGS